MRDPGSLDLASAEQLLRDGDVQTVLRHASRVLAGDATALGWLRLQGLALAASGRAAEARQCFRDYARRCPHDADAWVNLGNACLECGDAAAALQALEHGAAAGARGVPYLLAQGLALSAVGRFAEALQWLQRAEALEPQAADLRLARGQCLAELERHGELDECVSGIDPGRLPFGQRTVLAWLLAQAGRDQAAQALYRELLAEDPAAVPPRVQLALLLERLNRVPEAAALLSGLESGYPTDSMSALALGRVARRQGDEDRAIAILDSAVGNEADPAMAAQLWFELAKCHDRKGQPDAAMRALEAAHRDAGQALRQRHAGLQEDRLLGWLGQRLKHPMPAPPPAQAGAPPEPVFLVGFPRSGTTLLEQMLGRHPALGVLEEKPVLEQAIAAMRALPGWRDDDLDASLLRLEEPQLQTLRTGYWSGVARHLALQGHRLVDKYPLSLTRVGQVQRLFPRSDWVLLLRHPCDCVLSCHLQAFGLNGGALAFASLESTARTYAEVMGYWEEQRPLAAPRVHTLRYEDLVANPHAALEALMAFLSLSPEPVQHAFPQAVAARERRINTPSYAQVSEPVHGRAVGHWRRYRAHFTPAALALLAPFVARYGYTLD